MSSTTRRDARFRQTCYSQRAIDRRHINLGGVLDPLLQSTDNASAVELHGGTADVRPGLAIIANVMTPYRANLHCLVAAGIPELKLHTLITHGVGDFAWDDATPPEVNPTNFSAKGEHSLDNPLRRPVAEWRKADRLIRHLQTHNIKAVIFCFYRYISYLRVMDYCCRAGIPFWVNLDSNIRSEPQLSALQSFVKRRLYDWWLKRASGVLSMGALGDQFFLKYGADPKRIYRVPYWPDFDAFIRCDNVALNRLQQKFGLDRRRHYIIYSGRLVPEKRVDLLIDAFSAIAAERPDWDLLIVGHGTLGDQLRLRVPKSLQQRVVWTGFLEGAENVAAFHAADILVLPSDQEPWALVIQEAMAAGLIVVASDIVGAAHELVEDHVSGRIFAAGNLQQLNHAIRDVTDPAAFTQYNERSQQAMARYRKNVQPVNEIRRALRDAGVIAS
jgi:glycosyltransferase involved in cell wall biosynthesis